MSARAHCQLNRRRRIVKADICDRHHLPVRAGDKRRQSALFFNGLLGLLSQKVAAVVETNHVFGEIHFSACEGLRWVCQDQVTRRRGFRRMSRV